MSAKTKIDGIKASIKRLSPERRMQYISLKATVPIDQQESLREAFLFFQDDDMMDTLVQQYA
tara:strand:+ start:6493 stop:6678 length:186 start_codon:yes stop_codon:yes gene_type:complete